MHPLRRCEQEVIVIHPPHLTLYAIVAATTCGASLVLLVFVSLYSIARVLVHLIRVPSTRAPASIHGAVLQIMPWPIMISALFTSI